MTDVKKTSNMDYPLEAPNGWFLLGASHQHDLEGSHYVPREQVRGAWVVTFQRTIYPSTTIAACGHSLEDAWAKAKEAAAAVQ